RHGLEVLDALSVIQIQETLLNCLVGQLAIVFCKVTHPRNKLVIFGHTQPLAARFARMKAAAAFTSLGSCITLAVVAATDALSADMRFETPGRWTGTTGALATFCATPSCARWWGVMSQAIFWKAAERKPGVLRYA